LAGAPPDRRGGSAMTEPVTAALHFVVILLAYLLGAV
jgi:hypothetical protein